MAFHLARIAQVNHYEKTTIWLSTLFFTREGVKSCQQLRSHCCQAGSVDSALTHHDTFYDVRLKHANKCVFFNIIGMLLNN
jgi:hypothetical protein